jgi:endonuclease YncB( thermonuclease family)
MMPNVFFTIGDTPRAIAAIRRNANGQTQSLDDSIPDGDTVGVHLHGSVAIRFLGIDTPEKQFDLAVVQGGNNLDSAQWESYLTDPFLPQFGPFELEDDLDTHLRNRIGSGAGANHRLHADNAKAALIAMVQSDMIELGQEPNTFGYFIAFSFEVFDSNGRFLAFINRNQPDANNPSPRPLSYNERMLEQGAALPYFIWPNIDPFRDTSLLDAVVAPGTANQVAQQTPALRRAREFVRQARINGSGVFDPGNALRFEAFEIRYLGRRRPPFRPIIDLSRNDNVILRPQSYFKIPNPEDRLFIPPGFVPLFVSRGWRLEGWA